MAGIKDRLIQFILRGKDELSPEAKKSAKALEDLRTEAASLNEQLDTAKGERGLVRDMLATQRALEQSQRVLGQTEGSIKELREALNDSPDAKGLQQSLKAAEREAGRLRRQVSSLSGDLGEHEKAAKAAGVDTNRLAEEEKRLAKEVDTAKKALAANGQELRAMEREQAKASRTAAEHASRVGAVREAMAGGVRQVAAFGAAYLSLNGIINLLRGGLNLVRDGIRAVITDGLDSGSALAQLEAALNSTGNAAGFTAEQLLEMAQGFRDSSLLTNEQIQAAQTRLLSYTDIVGEQFPKAMQIVIDQQQRLGISAESSAEIVGRALQSPVDAMAALGRQGFKLEDDQKRLLRQLVATGKTAEAQAVIMDMMTEAYGGAAAAAKLNTAAGLWKTITNSFSDFAGRVGQSGAFDYIQSKLRQLADGLDAMANDGRLDRLAQHLSDTFTNGAEAVSKYVEKLATVDFEGLAEKAAGMASKIGPAIDQTVSAGQYATAALTTVWNTFAGTVNASAAALTYAVQQTLGRLALATGQIASVFGGEDIKAKADGLYTFLGELSTAYAAQAQTDYGQVADAWSFLTESVEQQATEQTDTIKKAADDQFEHIVQRVTDINNALSQISSVNSVAQLQQLGREMFNAYQAGRLSQEEYSGGLLVLNERLREMGGAAKATSADVKGAAASLKTLSDIQAAISGAKTAVDIRNINTALNKLYNDGVISASEYNTELKKAADRQAELKKAVEGGKKAQDAKNESDKDAIVTSEQLRRESGKRMEAERQAGDAAMQQRRKESSDAKKDMGAMAGFYDGVMNAARGPLASLSAAALEAFDRLRGIKTADMNIDTSSLDATVDSLGRVSKALGDVRSQMGNPFTGPLGRWQLDMQESSLKTQQAFLGQQAQLQRLMESYDKGNITTRQFESRARGLRRALGMLDDADLSSLDSAIKSAQDSMEQMGQSTRSTLDSLQDELDGLQGRTEDIERRRFASRRRELEAQLAEANAGGDTHAVANASKALGMLRQIEAESAQARQADEQKKRQEEIAKAAAPIASANAAQAPQQPSRVIRLELGGKAVDVAVGSAADETNLLSLLEDAALRAR
ncbi:phage tail length tape measure family protein [Phytopseudomonas seleniipraecipitans]|uniref:Prophage tail length tape measure protein n=1 Tax=Phytopseudomonas seleniipraecipitans TaxID=640205 RepID=A0A1G7JBY4_9GAMM|nr:phage tail length tape measure family protein [Pseudomonas seleniipraecipitans]SDF22408.1 Prophage tail length tape measure protein [Pseudomonas seleniipraecipitans]